MRYSNIWRGNHVCICITGSSRGLGKQIAIGFSKHFNDCHKCELNCNQFSLSFVLISRDVSALQKLSQEISSIDCHIKIVDIICGSIDDNITVALFEKTCQTIASNHIYDQIIIVHNAGSLGDVNLLTNQLDINSKEMLNSYFELNLFSVMQMTGIFLKLFAYIKHKTIINITSLAALTPFKGLSLYCIGICLLII
jgi:short-subunit dehydrogenase